jgi:hypothetical protein
VELTITVCDVCRDPKRQVKRYSISEGERSVTVDLCDQDDRFLAELLRDKTSEGKTPVRGRPQPAVPKATRGAGRLPRIKVIDPADIPRTTR